MRNTSNRDRRADRGVSELVGVVLLFGIVIAGSAMIFVSGTAVTEDIRAEGRVDAASSAVAEMDSSVQSLAQRRGNDQEAVSMGAVDPNKAEIRDTGELEIQINGESACTATMNLSALEYDDDGGTTIAYEGGAIWKRTDAGIVTQKAPELGFQNGALQLQVVRIDGSVEDDEMSIDYDRAESISKTEDVCNALFATSNCRRPQELSITITSDYYQGWTDHLESQFGASNVTVDADAQRVTAEADLDVEYDVIDIPGSGPGTIVTSPSGDDRLRAGPASPLYAGVTPAGDTVEYSGTVTFLGSMNADLHEYTSAEETWDNETVVDDVTLWANRSVQLPVDGNVEVQVNDTEFYWDNRTKTEWNNTTVRKRVNGTPPLEVSFVLDESGSMQWGDKMTEARDATREFLSVMKDDQGHRVNLVGYDYCSQEVYWGGWYDQWRCGDVELDVTTYQEFTTDQRAVSDALPELQVGGGTPIPQAVEHASDEFRADGNASNNQVLILLTDGKDEAGAPYPYETAQEEIPDDVTVYTIGVGDDVNEGVLENVATTGNGEGEYIPVSDADELDSVFSAIARNETTEVVHINESTNVTVPVKKQRTEGRTVTIPLDEGSVQRDVNVSRYLANPEDYEVGDTVWVNGTRTVAAGETVSVQTSVNRTIEYANGTVETEPVPVSRLVELSSSRDVTVNESVVLSEAHTRWENESTTTETTHNLVLRRPTTLELTYNGSAHDLWSGENVNAFAGGVERGAYSNVVVEQGSMLEFLPESYECEANTTHDEQVDVGGTGHNLTTCTTYGSTPANLNHEVGIYANGEPLPSASAPGWQTSLQSMLTLEGRQYYERQGGDLVASNLSSNQAIVVVESDDEAGRDSNNVVMLVELGESDETTGKHLVNVEVTAVAAQSGDGDDDDE